RPTPVFGTVRQQRHGPLNASSEKLLVRSQRKGGHQPVELRLPLLRPGGRGAPENTNRGRDGCGRGIRKPFWEKSHEHLVDRNLAPSGSRPDKDRDIGGGRV